MKLLLEKGEGELHQIAQLDNIPAIIKTLSDDDGLELLL
ncbi:MAG: hypothetical protein CM15mP73_5620 [Hyphomicrobiales bacterium]|nr:MAG: hypothetical protein CM15mP73_5620 [Hyphomicrobiales bacterium]